MPRNSSQTTCDIPRALAQEIRDLIADQRTPAQSLNEYVRHALARQIEHDNRQIPRAAPAAVGEADSSFAAESAIREPRSGAVDVPRSAPGFAMTPAVGAEDDCVS